MGSCSGYASSLTRKKTVSPDNLETKLDRCYGLSDLIYMGIGFMVGTGIFVLSGEVVRYEAGAGAILSFLFAGIAATLSALCFAEFGGMVPVAGSGYVYTYVVVGEVWAFAVGWSMSLEYIIGSASAAKAFSGTLDSLCNYSISKGIESTIGRFGISWLSPYPDFIALLLVLLVMIFVCISAQTSSNFNKVMVTIKLITIAIIIIAGFMLADVSNWTDQSNGGFAPYGVAGVFTGAATCFYAYVGFDSIAIASEETKNPKKTVPVSIIVSMIIVTLLYVISTMVLSLMVPYDEVIAESPFSSAFLQRGESWAQYVVGVGTLFGLTTVILSGLYSLPRLLYAMANDGLIFRVLGNVNNKTQTPILSITVTGFITGLIALFIDMTILVELLSIGTLMSFTFVAGCIIILRYDTPVSNSNPDNFLSESLPLKSAGGVKTYTSVDEGSIQASTEEINSDKETLITRYRSKLQDYIKYSNKKRVVLVAILIAVLSTIVFMLLLILAYDHIKTATWWALLLLVVSSLGIVVPTIFIGLLDQAPKSSSFQVPLVPFIPVLSIFFNIGLMMMLDPWTWVRNAVWLILGFLIYFIYGMKHSNENAYKSPESEAT